MDYETGNKIMDDNIEKLNNSEYSGRIFAVTKDFVFDHEKYIDKYIIHWHLNSPIPSMTIMKR